MYAQLLYFVYACSRKILMPPTDYIFLSIWIKNSLFAHPFLPSLHPLSNGVVCLRKFNWLRYNALIIRVNKFLSRRRIIDCSTVDSFRITDRIDTESPNLCGEFERVFWALSTEHGLDRHKLQRPCFVFRRNLTAYILSRISFTRRISTGTVFSTAAKTSSWLTSNATSPPPRSEMTESPITFMPK